MEARHQNDKTYQELILLTRNEKSMYLAIGKHNQEIVDNFSFNLKTICKEIARIRKLSKKLLHDF